MLFKAVKSEFHLQIPEVAAKTAAQPPSVITFLPLSLYLRRLIVIQAMLPPHPHLHLHHLLPPPSSIPFFNAVFKLCIHYMLHQGHKGRLDIRSVLEREKKSLEWFESERSSGIKIAPADTFLMCV